MLVRPADPTDAPDVSELLTQLGYPLPTDRVAAKLAQMTSNAFDAVYVAQKDHDRVIGCIGMHTHELIHVDGRLGRITALVVDEKARGFGAGTALIVAAERFFTATGCIKIEVTSADHRRAAHRFYEARGFHRDEKRYLKRLGTGTALRRD